jgi:Endonuclease/Exonuclease/phosphatase family
MEVRIMSWNMAGAKLFEQLDPEPGPAAESYTAAFRKVWEKSIGPWLATPDHDEPDIILLQECIGFEDHSASPSGRWQNGIAILEEIFSGYECFFFPAVTSHNNPHPGKWNRYAEGGAVVNFVPAHVDIQQGYGICVREGVSSRKLWVPWPDPKDVPSDADRADPDCVSCFEPISITTGLYLGNRDTEPRIVIMGRAKLESGGESRYLNYLNIHLNTLSGEREGNVRLNRSADASRTQQIELILDNVISAYQEATRYRMPEGMKHGERDIWIVGGDFNTTPDSAEIAMIRRAGFVDTIPDKSIQDANPVSTFQNRIGSKWSLGDTGNPPIVLDYIFCGLEQFTFPAGDLDVSGSKRPFIPGFDDLAFASDHAVLFAKIRL